MSICRDFVRRGSRPGELGDEGKGDRKGDCIGLLRRLALLRAAKKKAVSTGLLIDQGSERAVVVDCGATQTLYQAGGRHSPKLRKFGGDVIKWGPRRIANLSENACGGEKRRNGGRGRKGACVCVGRASVCRVAGWLAHVRKGVREVRFQGQQEQQRGFPFPSRPSSLTAFPCARGVSSFSLGASAASC